MGYFSPIRAIEQRTSRPAGVFGGQLLPQDFQQRACILQGEFRLPAVHMDFIEIAVQLLGGAADYRRLLWHLVSQRPDGIPYRFVVVVRPVPQGSHGFG